MISYDELAKLIQQAIQEEAAAWSREAIRSAQRQERERRDLDATNWDKEPIITHRQLEIMSHWRAYTITVDPKWQDDPYRLVLINTCHPDNQEWVERRRAIDLLRNT